MLPRQRRIRPSHERSIMATITRKAKGGKWYAIYTDEKGKQRWKAAYTDKAESLRYAQRMEDEARAIRLGDVDPQAEARRVQRAKPATDHIADYETYLKAKGCNKWHVSYTIGD